MPIEHAAMNLPNSVYWLAGMVVLSNLGLIVTLSFAAFKSIWWVSKLDSRVNEAKAMAVRAHKRIDQLES